ncbi:hypothetical protein ACIQGZ_16805 [Streptomyces sp. NPDC092296]|uniref:hypothetical protein n=1 Tax=Streptomyces sp. NPDC092296 TaxID=3366012 RepID=UPI0038091F36
MNAKDPDAADEWPLPPSWMWGCEKCTELYRAMKRAPEVVEAARAAGGPGVDYDPMDSVVSTQIRLAHHIASTHAADVPDVDPSCDRCLSDTRRATDVFVLEHRARHLFIPPAIAGLL